MRVGILSAGGDCPGINATIRGVGKTALTHFGMEIIGIKSGFSGLLEEDYLPLNDEALSGLLNLGGTILGTSREKPFKKSDDGLNDKPQIIVENYRKLGLDCLVCIGGNGTQKTAFKLAQLGLNIIGIPKTIDNDVWGTDISFGFHTAVDIATEAIDRLHSTASSHKRVMIIELMGHHAGWITLYAGMAGGADVILLPELGYDMEIVNQAILVRAAKGKPYSIVAACEGLDVDDKRIEQETGIETRKTTLGYVQRGGSPSAFDRNLATRLGGHATELIVAGKFGRMVCLRDDKIDSIPLSDVVGKMRLVAPDHNLITQGKRMGISFGID